MQSDTHRGLVGIVSCAVMSALFALAAPTAVAAPCGGAACGGVSLDGAKWIWHKKTANVPTQDVFLRTRFSLPADAGVAGSSIIFSCDNGGVLKLNGSEIARQATGEDDWRTPTVRWDVASALRPGENVLEAVCSNIDGYAGFAACLDITLKDGRKVTVRTDDATWESSADGKSFECAASGGEVGCKPWGRFPALTMRSYPGVPCVVSEWISAADAAVADGARRRRQLSADGTSWFRREFVNPAEIKKATWAVAGLGVFEVFANGRRVGGEDALKPGFTHAEKTKVFFTYDVTSALKTAKGARNVLTAEVSAGWWRDQIVRFIGKKSAFRGELELEFADGTRQVICTRAGEWQAGVGGKVKHADIFGGEIYDARASEEPAQYKPAVANKEFTGCVVPTVGAEIRHRFDLALKPVEAYCWKGVDGAAKNVFGTVRKTRTFKPGELLRVVPGETLVIDFGQNAAAVPHFTRMNAKDGTVLTCLTGEMLNDRNGERKRGNDGPGGSLYRENLRIPDRGMRVLYTFDATRDAEYLPRFTFFGYRYVSITATDEVSFLIESVPVTSIKKEMELGRIETGVKDVNRLISNVYWGQLSNYLSVPTDCPQRNERLGWTADTQVFVEAGSFNADTSGFFHKWMRDMRDTQHPLGGFPGVAPFAQYGSREGMRLGWADAGVIVPYQVWKQFGDVEIVKENWSAMEKYVARCNETRYENAAIKDECRNYQWADWLSYEPLESCGGGSHRKVKGRREPKPEAIHYWEYLGACYWLWDSEMMSQMAGAIGDAASVSKYKNMASEARKYLKGKFFDESGKFKLGILNTMQTPALFALKLGLVDGEAKTRMAAALRKNIADHGDCLQTGFLGTSILMDTLTENGMADVAYTLLLQHKDPSWLYSVDQGATTIWERWNSYTKERGFGPVGMNSFNHYAYGAVLAWIYKTAAGIAADPANPGFRNIIMAPKPDRRLGYVKAEYKSAAGLIKSAWSYKGDVWTWTFTIPEGATATVTLPGETTSKTYRSGTYTVEK